MKNKSEVDKCLKKYPPNPKTVPSNTHTHRCAHTFSSVFKIHNGASLQ